MSGHARAGRCAAALALIAAATCGAADQPDGASTPPASPDATAAASTRVVLDLTPADRLEFHGMHNLDKAGGGTMQMLYAAPSFAAMLVEVATHGVLAASSNSAAKRKLQEQADEVLKPYRELLDGIRPDEMVAAAARLLRRHGIELSAGPAQAAAPAGALRFAPVFQLSQDQRAFAVEGPMEVPPLDAAGTPYRNLVRVVGQPLSGDEPARQWQDHDGTGLRRELSALLAEAVEAAVADARRGSTPEVDSQRTFRYPEGGSDHYERGTLIAADCERIRLRNLRGALFSVPHGANSPLRPPRCTGSGSNPGS